MKWLDGADGISMSMAISELLNRRTNLSGFVVHFTKDADDDTAAENLRSIIRSQCLEARWMFGWARFQLEHRESAVQDSQRCVCFSEAPFEHLYSLVASVSGRQVHLQPYGLALTKQVARRSGINPILYVDMSVGRRSEAAGALNTLRDSALRGDFAAAPIGKVLPFVDPMGTWEFSSREFAWEREWRKVGSLSLRGLPNLLWLCPEHEIDDFTAFAEVQAGLGPASDRPRPRFVDPRWSTDRIIAELLPERPTSTGRRPSPQAVASAN